MTGVSRSRLRLAEVTDQPLDVDRHRTLVSDPAGGAEVVFCGVVRDHDHGRVVTALEYVGHPDAGTVIERIAAQFAAEPGVLAVAVSHRIGALSVGDVAFVAAVSCAHRGKRSRTVRPAGRSGETRAADLEATGVRRRHRRMGQLPVAVLRWR